MRTTISLDDHLLADLKRRAALSGSSVSRLIEEAVRRLLCETEAGQDPGTEFELVTWGKGGSFSRLSIDKTSRLLELDDLQEFASQ